jgi:uncharacterized pyridoxamine 5'-phosphate oxidase family protein
MNDILALSVDYDRLRNEHQIQIEEINQLRKMILEFKPILEEQYKSIEEQNIKNQLKNCDIDVLKIKF